MDEGSSSIAVIGAGGLIGQAVGEELRRRGFRVVAVARRFGAAQANLFAPDAIEERIVDLDVKGLGELLARSGAGVIVNCLGVLQDAPGASTREVHEGFVARLLSAMGGLSKETILIHLSVPGREEDDATAFSATKRAAERAIVASSLPHVILRPGFVIARGAYGGSALMRALGILPLDLPREIAAQPFAVTASTDIAATIAWAAREHAAGRDVRAVFDVRAPDDTTVGEVVEAFRHRLGGPPAMGRATNWMMSLGARVGDLAAWFGWAPPIRSTALAELRRGVAGDASTWLRETRIRPSSAREALSSVAVSVQENWFARLYLAKFLVISVLAAFWLVSGLLPLTTSFHAATAILLGIGIPKGFAEVATIGTSLLDLAIGVAIAHRRTCRIGLVVGALVAFGYVAGAAFLVPALWLDPLGAMVKTVPAIVLMLVALLILEAR